MGNPPKYPLELKDRTSRKEVLSLSYYEATPGYFSFFTKGWPQQLFSTTPSFTSLVSSLPHLLHTYVAIFLGPPHPQSILHLLICVNKLGRPYLNYLLSETPNAPITPDFTSPAFCCAMAFSFSLAISIIFFASTFAGSNFKTS